MKRLLAVALFAFPLAGCYRNFIETSLQPSPQRVTRYWSPGFLYGIIAPPTLDVKECKSGVAKLEQQRSFLQGLVMFGTWGIYSPVTQTATCAAPSAGSL